MENPEIFSCCPKCKDRHLAIEAELDKTPKRWNGHIQTISNLTRKIYKCCGYFNEMDKYFYEIIDTLQYSMDQSKKPFQYMDVRTNLVKIRMILDDYKGQLQAGINNHKLLIKAVTKFGYFTDYQKKYQKRILNKIHIRSLKIQIARKDELEFQALEKESEYKQKIELLQEALHAATNRPVMRDQNLELLILAKENSELKQRIKKLEADQAKVQSLLKSE